MAKFKPQYRRLLFIDRKIREGVYPNCSGLAVEWETSSRTIQRDIDYIRYELDAPLAYDASKKGYFYTDNAWFMPSVMLTEGDLLALLIGEQATAVYSGTPVAGDLSRIYAKLSELLPEKISIGPEFIQARFSFFNPPSRPISPDVWQAVLRALLRQKVLEIDYRSPVARDARRHVLHPYHVLNMEGDWYMLAHSERFGEIRQFALSRVIRAAGTKRTFSLPEDFDLEAALKTRFGRYLHQNSPGRRTLVRLLFKPALNRYIVEKNWHPEQKIRERKNGSVELALPVAETLDVESWILSFGEHVSVLSPKDLKEKIKNRHLTAARDGEG